MTTPMLPPPPSSLSNRTRSKVPPRLTVANRSSSNAAGVRALSPVGASGANNENVAPNFETSPEEWAAFQSPGGSGDEGMVSPAFMSTTEGGDTMFGRDGSDEVAAAQAQAQSAATGGFGSFPSSPPRNGGRSVGHGSFPPSSPSDRRSSPPPPPPPPLPTSSAGVTQEECIEVMRALSPAPAPAPASPSRALIPRQQVQAQAEGRNDFESNNSGSEDWGPSSGNGGMSPVRNSDWMREPIEAGGVPPLQPPLSEHHNSSSDSDANADGGPLPAPRLSGGQGGATGGRRGRPPIGGNAGARPPRPAGAAPAPAAAPGGGGGAANNGNVVSATPGTLPALPPPPGSMSPNQPERRRIRGRGRSSSPAAGTRGSSRGSRRSAAAAAGRAGGPDGNASDSSSGMGAAARTGSPARVGGGNAASSAQVQLSPPPPPARRRSRSRDGRRSRTQSQGRNGGRSTERRGRSKSRGRSVSRDAAATTPGGSAANGAGGRRTPSQSARSRSRPRDPAGAGPGSAPTTPGSNRRSRSTSRGPTSRARSRSRSRNETPRQAGGSTTPSSVSSRLGGGGGGRSRSSSRPRGGPPLSASAGMARVRSRSIPNGGGTLTYASDGELGSGSGGSSAGGVGGRPPSLGRTRSNDTQSVDGGNSSVISAPGGLSGGGAGGGTNNHGPPGTVERSTSNGTCSANGGHIKRNNSFTNLRERLFGDSVTPQARRSYLPPRTPNGGRGGGGNGGNGGNGATDSSGRHHHHHAEGYNHDHPVLPPSQQPEAVYTRTLLTASVYHNQATDLWITTINTNQDPKKTTKSNASRYLKAFSFNTEREARESAYANAPPKMIPFSQSPHCFICRGKFALFRRASHCRNCGVCVCSSCSSTWPSKMIPETYNMKKSKNVKVCKSCNFLAGAFRRALTEGQYEEAVALYNTGNINLRCPFANVKGGGEVMFPIHCAAAGGNLDLLRWLVDVHHCPIKLVRTGNKNKERGVDEPILTSKGRTILGLAMSAQRVDVLRYLVSEKMMSVHEVKDLKTSLLALEAVLNAFPRDYDDLPAGSDPALRIDIESTIGGMCEGGDTTDCVSDYGSTDGDGTTSEEGGNGFDGSDEHDDEDDSVSTTVADACILCYENSIDCVITPCGHQICCLECSHNLTACPVCNSEGQFIRIFKP